MCRAPRRVILDKAVGPWLKPTHGLMLGCPLAMERMSLATWAMLAPLRGMPSITVRAYVDDLQQQSKKGKKKDEEDKKKANEFRDKAMETLKRSKLLLT